MPLGYGADHITAAVIGSIGLIKVIARAGLINFPVYLPSGEIISAVNKAEGSRIGKIRRFVLQIRPCFAAAVAGACTEHKVIFGELLFPLKGEGVHCGNHGDNHDDRKKQRRNSFDGFHFQKPP